jgi:hypothetical protein
MFETDKHLFLLKGGLVKLVCCTLVFIFFSKIILAQSYIIDDSDSSFIPYFYEPFPQQPGKSIFQIGGSFSLLPIPVVENEYPIPAIDVQFKHGIMKNVSLVSSLSTNYFSNLLHVGLQWNSNSSHLSLGLANHLGGFVGFISSEGQFEENSAYALFYMPIIRFGIRTEEFSVSMSFTAAYILKSVSKVSDLEAAGPTGTWNDFFCTLAIEQPMFKRTIISIGLSLAFSRSPYQTWLLFNTIDQYQFVPEFFFAIQL